MEPTILNVFVSSTWIDLQPEREAVENALQRLREAKFIGMEYFGSREDTPREASLAEVDRCQLYIGIVGGRYGSGITEAEYQRAVERNVPCFVYMKAETTIEPEWTETTPEKRSALAAFVAAVKSAHIVSEFTSPEQLAWKVTADLHRWLMDTIVIPAANQAANPEYPLEKLEAFLSDIRRLTEQGTRSVVVGGNNSGTINTGDVILQVLSQASPPLQQYLQIDRFRSLIHERTRDFVGRDFVFQAIDNYISSGPSFPSGYVVVRGEPGIGKTALTCQIVKMRGYIHHFNVAAQNIRSIRDFLGNICAQLIVRYKLDYATLPEMATQDSGFLAKLLDEAVAKAHDLPLIITVDALDEAEDVGLPPNANRLFLPPTLPDGVFFLITTREKQEYRLSVDRRKDIFIDDACKQNLDDVHLYISNFIDQNRGQLVPQITLWNISEAIFINIMTEKSQGNFMYVVHVLRDIRDGLLTPANLDSIYDLPTGLKEYYQRHWRTMRDQDPARFKNYTEPVVCCFAAAREPVPIAQVVDWTRRRWPDLDATAIREVVLLWREFLNADPSQSGPPHYKIYHTSFQDFLKEEVGLTSYHAEIGLSALSKIPGFLKATV